MKLHFIIITCLISLCGQGQSLPDSVKIFHDKEGYLRCVTNGEFSAAFIKSDLETISTSRVLFNAKSKTFRIRDNNNLSGSDFDMSLVLDSKMPKVVYGGVTYNLDSIDDSIRIAESNTFKNNIIGSLVFITRFENRALREITFGVRTGMVFRIKVSKGYKDSNEYAYYEIQCKKEGSNSGLFLEYSSNYGTPFSLLFSSETSHTSILLYSEWRWKKFKWLSVSEFEVDRPLVNLYRIYYNKDGKAKKNTNLVMSEDKCE